MMKKIIGKLVSVLLTAAILTGCFGNSAFAKVNYNKYSNTKKSWYIMRQEKHKPSGGADSAKNLRKYNAYYYDSKTKEKVMYFTFDCGYENGYTPKMLDTLKKHGVKATFFVTKAFVESNPKLCKRMKEEGHLVGNHTLNHPSLPAKSVKDIKKEVRGLEKLFKEKTGYELDKFIRPPKGEFSSRVLKVLQKMGYTTAFWSIAYYDYDTQKQPGKNYVVEHFKKYYHKGAITLTHNISKSNMEALDDVLTFLEGKGYRFAALSELNK
ncbi:MAG: polysaccharide deacetylase family protein [Lachnospiraceae bacterium]|nr:polysaccharide deacetylase family protein [Lachnospiraceae bacterium]